MLFSILVAHYNNFEYFKNFYKSVLAQTYQNFEIIIVDDCSTDYSLDKIKTYTEADFRVKIFENETNKGVGFTKRRCVELATGEICGFIDPDDAVSENALELSIQSYIENPEIVGTYSQIMLCDYMLQPQKTFNRTRKVSNGKPLFFNINNEISHFFTFRKNAYMKTEGINPKLTVSEDFDLYLKIYEVGNLFYIPKPLYLYRLHDQGISQGQLKKKTVHRNWDAMLMDACKRRNITKIGNIILSDNCAISKIIFEKENTLAAKVNRRIYAFFQ